MHDQIRILEPRLFRRMYRYAPEHIEPINIDLTKLLLDVELKKQNAREIAARRFIDTFGVRNENEAMDYLLKNSLISEKDMAIGLFSLKQLQFEYETTHRFAKLCVHEGSSNGQTILYSRVYDHFKPAKDILGLYIPCFVR